MDLWIVLLTGLTIGGFSCLAVQGGLLASVIAATTSSQKNRNFLNDVLPVGSFLLAKLFIYTLLGFGLGLLGKSLTFSDQFRLVMQFIAGIYMILVALNLLNVHPIFRYVIIQPPYFIRRMIRKESKSTDLFATVSLGLMTVFIPCGTTLAMEVLALSTANPWWAAAVMGVFTLGTIPLFFGIGYATRVLGERFSSKFTIFAVVMLVYLGILSINGSLVGFDAPVTLQKLAAASPIQIDLNGTSGAAVTDPSQLTGRVENGVQVIDINVSSSGYSPNYLRVKRNQPVKLNLLSSNVYSCALSFRIPSLGIVKDLKPTGTDSVEFTPENSGKLSFNCSMGMYRGTIEVI